MDVILFLQALEPRAVVHLVFAGISWCGDGPLYFLLFPLLYWGKAPSVAVRYGYLWEWAILVMIVLKGSTATVRPFLAAPEQVAFLQPLLAGFSWFPSPDLLREAYRQSSAFPSGHALVATALGLYLAAHTPSVGWRCLLGSGIVLIPVARVYLGVHYPIDVLAGSAIGALHAQEGAPFMDDEFLWRWRRRAFHGFRGRAQRRDSERKRGNEEGSAIHGSPLDIVSPGHGEMRFFARRSWFSKSQASAAAKTRHEFAKKAQARRIAKCDNTSQTWVENRTSCVPS